MFETTWVERLSNFWAATRPWLLTLAGLGTLGWFYYFLTTIGPRPVESTVVRVRNLDDPAIVAAVAEIDRREAEYRRAVDADLVTPEAVAALEEAEQKQEELVRTYPQLGGAYAERLVKLQTEVGSVRARTNQARIAELQGAGQAAMDAGRPAEAEPKLREALRLQHEANSSEAEARFKNFVREASLQQTLENIAAAPLQEEVEAKTAQAREAAAARRWGNALELYLQARDAQNRINREYPKTKYASVAAADRLEVEISSLNATGLAENVDAQEKAGDAAMAAGNYAEAAPDYGRAVGLQTEINRRFGASRFVSARRLEELEAKRQTATSSPEVERLEALDRTIADLLAHRKVVAAEQPILEAEKLAGDVLVNYPKSRRLDARRKIKFSYLALRRGDLRAVQDQVYDAMVPLPEADNRLMERTEFPQALYALVMNTNPSRNPGRELPVDSVSWSEAKECCERLGWMLGTEVRLPTEAEFAAVLAAGPGEVVEQADGKARSQAVGGHAPNALGFQDIAGNLSEWLDASGEESRVVSAGGNYQTPGAELMKEVHYRGDRARQIGFRVVVELPSVETGAQP